MVNLLINARSGWWQTREDVPAEEVHLERNKSTSPGLQSLKGDLKRLSWITLKHLVIHLVIKFMLSLETFLCANFYSWKTSSHFFQVIMVSWIIIIYIIHLKMCMHWWAFWNIYEYNYIHDVLKAKTRPITLSVYFHESLVRSTDEVLAKSEH